MCTKGPGSAWLGAGAQNFLASFTYIAILMLPFLQTGKCGDDRHPEPSGLLGTQLLSVHSREPGQAGTLLIAWCKHTAAVSE